MLLVLVLCMTDKLDTVTIEFLQFVCCAGIPMRVVLVQQFLKPVSIAPFGFKSKKNNHV